MYLQIATLLGAGVAFIFSIRTWRKTNRIKRSEFLEHLIKEFNDPKTFIARKILDDFSISTNSTSNLDAFSDQQLINMGSERKIKGKLFCEALRDLLRDHKISPVTAPLEQRARQSFDDLLDFFSKIEYYIHLDLISNDELSYFEYYLRECVEKCNGVILKYALIYHYDSFIRLIYILNIPIEEVHNYKLRWYIRVFNTSKGKKKRFEDFKNRLKIHLYKNETVADV